MDLGAFSISLAVKDLAASRAFYEKLGFKAMGGGDHYQILKNGTTIIGLFQGMFENNILTFNPRWSSDAQEVPGTDVRELAKELEAAGLELHSSNVGDSPSGPAHLTLIDPDGNAILIDQHV